MQVVIIGAGNTATVLGRRIQAAGHQVQQVYARNLLQASTLANELNGKATDNFSHLYLEATVYLLAISDAALPGIAAAIPRLKGLVLHTAGAVSMQVLEPASSVYGVLYPLQSLRKEKISYEEIPLLVDGNTETAIKTVTAFAQTLSNSVTYADDAYRLHLHTAAVVVSNFTNHLYVLAADFCRKENTNFQLLQPLIEEVAVRMRQFHPAQMQTGPAMRGDEATIYRHLQLLDAYPLLQQLYRQLTASIQQYAANKQL